jgi:hypothetical protein
VLCSQSPVALSLTGQPSFIGLPIGDWATWTGSFLAGLSLLLLVSGSLHDRGERRRLDESAQARLVGAWLQFIDVIDTDELWELNVQNASSLPVRNVVAYLTRSSHPPSVFKEIQVLPPGLKNSRLRVSQGSPDVDLILAYTDDAGVRWRKYFKSEPITKLSPADHDFPSR